MSLAILLPSLNRPQRVAEVATNIHAVTPQPHTIYWCVSDTDSKLTLDHLGEQYIDDSDSDDRRYVVRMNKLARVLTSEDDVFFGSDDVLFHDQWYERAKAQLDRGAKLVVVNDLHNANGTAALIRRQYLELAVFDSPGDAFHEGYFHNFADNEQFYTAYVRGVYAKAPNSFVEHLHPVFRGANAIPWDSTYENASPPGSDGWRHDADLFAARSALILEAVGGRR